MEFRGLQNRDPITIISPTSQGRGWRSIAASVYVCLSGCLFVCPLAYLESPTLTKFSVHVIRNRGSDLLTRQRDVLCASGFMDDVMLAHSRTNRPKNLYTCWRTSAVIGRYLCNYSFLTLVRNIDAIPLAMAIYVCSSFRDRYLYSREICIKQWHTCLLEFAALHTSAVRPRWASAFADARGDKLVVQPCGYL